MNLIINMNPAREILVQVSYVPKKNKVDSKLYNIYLLFNITEKGIHQYSVAISTLVTVTIKDWSKQKRVMVGSSKVVALTNEKLAKALTDAKFQLEEQRKNVQTCGDIRNLIRTHLKTILTGKAPRGSKNVFQLKKEIIHSMKY